ncbi:MAG: hypothetical protein RL129_1052, partial [Actinomycetota bacterium]
KVPPVPTRSSSTRSISTTPAPSKVTPVASAPKKAKKSSSSRTVVTILAAVVLIALLVVSRNSSNTESTTTESSATPTASATESAAATESQASEPQAASAGHGAPQGIVAHYTTNGATIFWTAPAETEGISNYQVEISKNGGAFAVASTVPSSQLSLDISAGDTTGWCSFRVSTIYSDGTVVGGKVFGLPGQWS